MTSIVAKAIRNFVLFQIFFCLQSLPWPMSIVGHFHISRKIVIEHLAFAAGEARDGFWQVAFDHKNGKIAAAAYEWIVSRARDYVVDLFPKNASAVIASIKNSRHGIYFGRMEDQETIRCELASQVQPRNKANDVE